MFVDELASPLHGNLLPNTNNTLFEFFSGFYFWDTNYLYGFPLEIRGKKGD
jgi:hypothetical protein